MATLAGHEESPAIAALPSLMLVDVAAPLPSSWAPDNGYGAHGSPAVPVWLIAPCSSHGLGGVAAGTAGA